MPTRNRYRGGYGTGTDPKVATGELRGYSPNPVPENEADLRRYIDYELTAIKVAFDELADFEPEEAIDVTYTGTWVSVGNGVSYYYDRSRVYVMGSAKSGTGDIFTLPTGYRPPEDYWIASNGDGAFAEIKVTAATGVVSQVTGTAAVSGVSLNFSFRV